MNKPPIITAPTLVVIASDNDQLACAVAMSLIDDKRLLHEKFNRTRMPPWQAMTNHLSGAVTRGEILASMDDVLDHKKHFMMILSGYRDTPAWNEALTDFMKDRRLSATFLVAEGDSPPGPVRALFDAYTELTDENERDPVDVARVAIMMARHLSSVPLPERHMAPA